MLGYESIYKHRMRVVNEFTSFDPESLKMAKSKVALFVVGVFAHYLTSLFVLCISTSTAAAAAVPQNPSISHEEPMEWLKEGEYEKALKGFLTIKGRDPDDARIQEERLNSLGYELLNSNRKQVAIDLFRINSILYPDSFNVFDSLGEAYLANGQKKESRHNYQKSLTLNPQNDNARIALKGMQTKPEFEAKLFRSSLAKQFTADLDQLASVITETHPHPFLFIPKDEFWNLIEEKKKSIKDTTTYAEFIWMCSEIVASIGCGHSSLGWFNQESKMLRADQRFPLEAKLIDGRLYVSDALINSDRLEPGTEIFSINGKPVAEITTDIYKHISSQGYIKTYKRLLLNSYFTSYLPYSLKFPESYHVKVKGQLKPVQLKPLKEYQPKPRVSKDDECQGPLCFKMADSEEMAVLTIRSFAYYGEEREAEFKSFIDECFSKLAEQPIKDLIIDLRSNGGGSSFASTYLLRHLVKEPFIYFAKKSANNSEFDYQSPLSPLENRFDGNLYVLMDGNGHSSTGHFLSIVKDRKLATLIGEELGSNHFCTAAQKEFILHNTEITFRIARNTWFTFDSDLPKNQGVLPDHDVVQSIYDHINDIDTVMNYAVDLIENER